MFVAENVLCSLLSAFHLTNITGISLKLATGWDGCDLFSNVESGLFGDQSSQSNKFLIKQNILTWHSSDILHRSVSVQGSNHASLSLLSVSVLLHGANLQNSIPYLSRALGMLLGIASCSPFVMESVSLWVADAWTKLNRCSLIMTFSPSILQQQPNPVTQHWDSLFYYWSSEPLCSLLVLSTYLTRYSCAQCYTIVKRAASISSMNSYFKDNNSAVKMCFRLKLYKEGLGPRVTLSGQRKRGNISI